MKHLSKSLFRALTPCGLLLVFLLIAGQSKAVTLTIGTASGQVGDTVAVPVTVTGLVEDIRAYEMEVKLISVYGQCVGVNTAGTLSASWSVSYLSGVSTVTVVGASAAPLGGDGVLIELLYELGPVSGGPSLSFGTVLLNEGAPIPMLVNGSLSISALPVINISPDTGLMAVGDSLLFSTAAGTAPYTYTADDPVVADFTDDWLHALSPGYVTATAEDANTITDTTTGQIEVRAFSLTVGSVTAMIGQSVLIPVTLNDPTGYGIVAGEVDLTWYGPYASFVGIETAGTISAAVGWATPIVQSGPGQVSVVMAGTVPLTGAGVLFYLELVPTNSVTVTVGDQIFNETYPAVPISGYLTATSLPTIGLTPTTGSLVVGDQLQFSVSGTPTPPYVWSTDDPLLATISSSGLLLALGEGTVHVQAVDDLGAVALSGDVVICGLGMPPLVSSISANETVFVPVMVNRSLDGLNIYSYEIAVNYSPAQVIFMGAIATGAITSGWGSPTVVDDGGTVRIYHAGANSLVGCSPALIFLEFQGLPSLGSPYGGVSLSNALFNEGAPCTKINVGIACENVSAVPRNAVELKLWPNYPNPFNPMTTIRYSLADDGEMELAVFSARGERVRTLMAGWQPAGGDQFVVWDGRDENGRLQASGVYYTLLRSNEEQVLRKMVLLK